MDLEPIGFKKPDPAGIEITIWFGCLAQIDEDNFPALRTDGTVYENEIEITDDIVFTVVTDGFVAIKALKPFGSDWNSSLEGDRGSKSPLNSLNLILQGTDTEVRGFRKLVRNEPGVILWKDNCGGPVNLIGNPCSAAYISESTMESGAAAGDSRQTAITFQSEGEEVLIYKGNIDIKG